MTQTKIAQATAPVEPDDAQDVALAALEAAEQALRAARALLARRPAAAAPGRWMPLAEAQVLLGAPSPRATVDLLGRLGVAVAGRGRSRVVDRAALDAALAAAARPPRTARRAPPPVADDDDEDALLARAGLRVVGGRR